MALSFSAALDSAFAIDNNLDGLVQTIEQKYVYLRTFYLYAPKSMFASMRVPQMR